MRAGIVYGPDQYSTSAFQQTITLPPDLRSAICRFYYFPITGDVDGDHQAFMVIQDGTIYPGWQYLSNEQWWKLSEFGLLHWAGKTITLRFQVFNDGDGRTTAMYVDDVQVIVERWGGTAPEVIHLSRDASGLGPGLILKR